MLDGGGLNAYLGGCLEYCCCSSIGGVDALDDVSVVEVDNRADTVSVVSLRR